MACGCKDNGDPMDRNGYPADELSQEAFQELTTPTWRNIIIWLTFLIAILGYFKN